MSEEKLADRLAKLRMAKGVSARDMSLSLGQSENYINMIENRKTLPSMAVFFNICEYLSITPSQFFDDNVENPKLMNEFVNELNCLNEEVSEHLLAITKELNRNK